MTGTTSSEVEHLLAEGMGLTEGSFTGEEILAIRDRCRINLLTFTSGMLEPYSAEHMRVVSTLLVPRPTFN